MMPRLNSAGNALFMILVAIFLVGLLSKTMIEKDLDTGHISEYAADSEQLASIRAHESSLKIATLNVLREGVDPANIDDIDPNDANFDVAPHMAKIYHPFGGGAQYHASYAGWDNIVINLNTVITDVGDTAAEDIIAVGDVSVDVCNSLSLSPQTVVTQTAIDALQANTAITLEDGTTCTSGSCDGISRQCVRNAAGTEFVYYSLLHAQ